MVVLKNRATKLCIGCILGKMSRHLFLHSKTKTTRVGDLIHSDVCGPMETISLGKSRYYVLFKDDFSGWCEVKLMKSKSEVLPLFKLFAAAFKTKHCCTVRVLRSDNGGEYTSQIFQQWLDEA